MLGDGQDGRSRVAGDVAREDGGIDDKQVVSPVDLGVGVDDGFSAAGAAVVCAHADGSCFLLHEVITYVSSFSSQILLDWLG